MKTTLSLFIIKLIYLQIDICQNEKDEEISDKNKEFALAELEDFGNHRVGRLRSWLWNTMEYPWSSKTAQFVVFFSLMMVLFSTITFIISTIDELQEDEDGNYTGDFPLVLTIIEYSDSFVVCFFTFEYILRLICSPLKTSFMKAPMNIIDLVAIIPFWLSVLLEGLEDLKIIGKAGKIIRLVRVSK